MHARTGGKHKLVQMQLKRPAGALHSQPALAGGRGTQLQHRVSTQQTAAGVPGAAEADGGGVNSRGDDDDAEQHPPPAAAPPLKRSKAAKGSLDLQALAMPGDWANQEKHQHQQPVVPKEDAAALATHQGSAAASATGS